MPTSFPYPGISVRTNEHGTTILSLLYEADPQKAAGKKVWVEEAQMSMSPWLKGEYDKMTNKNLFRQEYLIDFSATAGQLVFPAFKKEATLEKSFPIPEHWTRIMSLDPHPGVPHAFLWCAVDPWGDRWYYRELWPSKVCFKHEGGRLVGKPGNCPPDDNRYNIRQYAQTLKYLESAENPENVTEHGKAFDEKIYKRVIDYAARSFGKGTNDDPEQENFQQRYQHQMSDVELDVPFFEDAKKDKAVGIEVVNGGLFPYEEVSDTGDKVCVRSHIHIFENRCPELIYQLENNRIEQLSPMQAERMDPTGMPIKVRNHMTDNLRYIEMSNPMFVNPEPERSTRAPLHKGLSY